VHILAPHHDGSERYLADPAPQIGDTVAVFVRVPDEAGVTGVGVRSLVDAEPRVTEAVVDRREAGWSWWRADLPVRNPVTPYRFLLRGTGGPRWLNQLGVFEHEVPDVTDFRLLTYDPPPAWARDAVVYQIFPDRFARSPAADGRAAPEWAIPCDWDTPVIGRGPETPYQLYGGDLDGIAGRLDHLASLGVDTIYLTPIFPAPSNHRYNATAFDRVDPLLGGEEALARLAAAVHERGWRLLGDVTTNHCGDTHPWFDAARSDVTAPDREMFYFNGSGDYVSWLGVKSLPKLNWGSALLRERFCHGPDAVLARWLRPPYGLDGWRVDVANMTGRLAGDDFNHEVARLVRAAVTATRPDALLIAEHGHDPTGDLDRDGWHGVMNYAGFTRPVWSWLRADDLDLTEFMGVAGVLPRHAGPAVQASMRWFAALASWRSLTTSWQLLGSHDTPRIRTTVGGPERGEVAAGLLLTLPGTPMIFAGDELGLRGVNGEDSRTPMPWHRPRSWDRRTLDYYQRLVALRRSRPALRTGGLRWLYADADALVFVREAASEAVLVLARRAAGAPVRLPGLAVGPGLVAGADGGGAVNVYGGADDLRPDAAGVLTLPGGGPTFQAWHLRHSRRPRRS
jgi:alpha-glucosidase